MSQKQKRRRQQRRRSTVSWDGLASASILFIGTLLLSPFELIGQAGLLLLYLTLTVALVGGIGWLVTSFRRR
jgi:uncharacterized membrane protein